MFGYNDQELLEQFYFNFQVNYALGIRNLGEIYLAERTLYEFRERVYKHILEYLAGNLSLWGDGSPRCKSENAEIDGSCQMWQEFFYF
jgi:hypothetical protein